MTKWPLDIDGKQFHRVRRSWVESPAAVDHDPQAPSDAIRLYAASAALVDSPRGHKIHIRYLNPRLEGVFVRSGWAYIPEDSKRWYPAKLRRGTWKRSYVPRDIDEPDGTYRTAEREWVLELFGDEIQLSIGSESERRAP